VNGPTQSDTTSRRHRTQPNRHTRAQVRVGKTARTHRQTARRLSFTLKKQMRLTRSHTLRATAVSVCLQSQCAVSVCLQSQCAVSVSVCCLSVLTVSVCCLSVLTVSVCCLSALTVRLTRLHLARNGHLSMHGARGRFRRSAVLHRLPLR
jgi:hypothetical protein